MEGAAEGFGRPGEAGVGGGDFFGVAVAHQAGNGEGKDVFQAVGTDGGDAAFVLDEKIDHAGQIFIGGADGDDVMAVVGDAGGDGAGLETDAADEGRGWWSVLVAVDHGDFEDVTRWVGHGAVVLDEGLGQGGSGDDLAVEGFDDADNGSGWLEGACRTERTSGPLVPTLGGER